MIVIEDEERKIEIVQDFKHKGVRCLVLCFKWKHEVRSVADSLKDYHNGYVQTKERIDYHDVEGTTEELTFSGNLDKVKGWFLGFDSLHGWNDQHPESKTEVAVMEATRELADELILKNLVVVKE